MTENSDSLQAIVKISTHILTKRMTVETKGFETEEVNFNSHPHEEDDRNDGRSCS